MTLQFRCRVIFFVPQMGWGRTLDNRARRFLSHSSPVGGVRYALHSNSGDPACWRPAWGAGFDCAALFGCRVRPYTRCAASLRMTRGLQGRGMKNKMPYQLV